MKINFRWSFSLFCGQKPKFNFSYLNSLSGARIGNGWNRKQFHHWLADCNFWTLSLTLFVDKCEQQHRYGVQCFVNLWKEKRKRKKKLNSFNSTLNRNNTHIQTSDKVQTGKTANGQQSRLLAIHQEEVIQFLLFVW